ncbi:16S rRNA (adenine(1518)-N(6)/adenine(1519)-N(6))-dimethyltransferase RsmA [Sodalis sp. CWE]|uniref:16S rRNA (adenine(1518)-N(6)/adenine(1519)-N(6))- dimethyltransferase RsmA n=1 Tax=Sodalis sp. CWE TaxID=2803816 RepID=UPI001C7D2E16|nr:16S rRNA (adenine(1518)-N(6)/adenine(1519)-N(6))-dimethyltransferase RsmA [Sodalis sp. CWE]MBX4180728.1 16S rRNA (adenine(1518)-N(6)/adenine(1519)-N(6))-dimethyltransferase RsmA [Sodalis sp. CWE]
MSNYIYQMHSVRKRFSQCFLHDRLVIDAIVDVIKPQLGQIIVEIGPGLGALTKPIAKRVKNITAIEIDRDLAKRLAKNSFLRTKLKTICQDVMTVDFTKLSTNLGGLLRIFGSLPYNISTPIIFHMFKHIQSIKDMYFILQKEVANRLVASPGSKDYGRLSIISQYHFKITPILEISSASFRPIPKVNSTVVRFLPYIIESSSTKKTRILAILTNLAFSQRRKTLRNSLSGFCNAQQLKECGIDAGARAENISIEHYCRLANFLENRFNLFFKRDEK